MILILRKALSCLLIWGLLQSTASAQLTNSSWDRDYVDLENMINTSGEPKSEIVRQLVWAQIFALAGSKGFSICRNYRAYDINIWAVSGVYYKIHRMIIRNAEGKVVKTTADNHTATEATLEGAQKSVRNKQIINLEQILGVQRAAIDLLDKQTSLLRNMRTVYYSSAALLTFLIILANSKDPATAAPKATLGITTVADLKCQKQNTAADTNGKTQVESKFWSSFWDEMSDILVISFEALNWVEKAFTHIEKLPKEQQKLYVKELEYSLKVLKEFYKVFKNNFLVNSAFAQIESSDKVVGATEKTTSKLKGFINSVKDFLGKTLLNPYVRVGLYATMGTITQFSVSRNNNEINTYTGKIDNFDKKIQQLKADIGDGALANDDSKDDKPPGNFEQIKVIRDIGGCVKASSADSKQDYVFDESCLCKKNNTCVNLKTLLPPNADEDTKKLFDNLNSLYNGDASWINDDKKADELYNLATKAADSSILELNKQQKANGEKPLDMRGNMKKLIKLSFAGSKQKLASNSSTNKNSGLSQKDISDLGLEVPDQPSGRSGIHLQNSDMEGVALQDVHQVPEDSVFDVISLRYRKTALPFFLKDEAAKR